MDSMKFAAECQKKMTAKRFCPWADVKLPDETADSYLNRTAIGWNKLKKRQITIEEMEAFIVLRQSQLERDDRKKVLVECFFFI